MNRRWPAFHATLTRHENLGSALSYMLANKLATPIMPAIAVREVVEEAYKSDNRMISFPAARDILADAAADPAVDKYSTPAALPQRVPCASRLTASAIGCGAKGGKRWLSTCKIKFPSPSADRHPPGGDHRLRHHA